MSSLTSAMNTSVNALALNETAISVIGNNIANADTDGFKASTALFATQLSQTISSGSAPSSTNGGTNPQQIGLGAGLAEIEADFTQGGITNTDNPSNLAIQGNGFFVLNTASGTSYTRDGDFSLNANNQLVTAAGADVQGYGVDSSFNLKTSQLQNLTIPLGNLSVAQQTTNLSIQGADSDRHCGHAGRSTSQRHLGRRGKQWRRRNRLDPVDEPARSPRDKSWNQSGRRASVHAASRRRDALAGDVRRHLQQYARRFDVVDGWMLGIQSGNGVPNDPNKQPAAGQPGVNVVNGQIQIVGNMGTVNNISFEPGDLTDNGSTLPINFTQPESANGTSTSTNFVVYDSLGTAITVDMTAVLQSTALGATTYRYFFTSPDNDGPSTALGTGTIVFGSSGQVVSGGTASFSVDRSGTAATNPMTVTANLSGISGIASATEGSSLTLASQNGAAPGTLSSYAIDANGVISGTFSNGAIETLGQVVLATFTNNQGLVANGDSTYSVGTNSGPAIVSQPNSSGAGSLKAGAVEQSNTDIGSSLVDLITVSTNYQGAARVISVADQLINDLLTMMQQLA